MALTKVKGSVWDSADNGLAVNVKDFGAHSITEAGYESFDSTSAIQAALDSGNSYVRGVSGTTYNITTGLTVPANVIFDLDGATLSYTGAIDCVTLNNGSIIKNGTIEGPDAGAYVANSNGVCIEGVAGSSSLPTRKTGCKVLNMTFNNIGDYSVKSWYTSDIDIQFNTITNSGYFGISLISANDNRVTDNYIDTVAGETSSNELNAYGISVSNINDPDTVGEPASEDCEIVRNIIKNIPNWHGITCKSGQRITMDYNTIIDCRRGIVLSFHQVSAEDCSISYNRIVNTLARSNNTVGANQQSEAIWDIGRSASVQNLRTIIKGNSIYQHGAGIGASGCIQIQYASDGVCDGNVLNEPWLTGIVVADNVDNYTITNNTIINPKSDGTGSSPAMSSDVARCIHFRNTDMNNITVSGNTLLKTKADGTIAASVGDIGILVNNTALKSIALYNNTYDGLDSKFSYSDTTGFTGEWEIENTVTLTGCTTSPTGTVRSVLNGNIATLHIPVITGTSNTTAMTLTGLHPSLLPARDQWCVCRGTDNGVLGGMIARIDSGASTITFFYGFNNSGFTSSGTKGTYFSTLTYSLS